MKTQNTHVEPEIEQVYQSQRSGEFFQIIYVDEEVVLLRCSNAGRNGQNTHRIERRVGFEKNIEAGLLEYKPESDLDMLSFDEVDWTEVPHIGEQAKENLYDEGFKTALDIQQASQEEIEAVPWVGELGANHLKQFAR